MKRVARVGARIASAAVSVLLGCLWSSTTAAAATGTPAACLAAYERSTNLQDTGDLIGAKAQLRICSAGACPIVLQRECIDSLALLEPRIPTVIPVARDSESHDLTEVTVSLDGAPWKARLDGRESEINPGAHKLRFEAAGTQPVERTFLILERAKGRFLEVELQRVPLLAPKVEAPVAAFQSPERRPPLVYILAGVGASALITGGVFGALALSARSDADACRPNCAPTRVDTVNQRLLVADVAVGVALVSLAVALWLELSRPNAPAHLAPPR